MVDIGPAVHQELDDRHLLGDGGQVKCTNNSHGGLSKAASNVYAVVLVRFRARRARYEMIAEGNEHDIPALKGGKSGVIVTGGWLKLTWSCCTAVMRRVLPWSSSASMSKPVFRVSSKRLFLPCLAYVGVQEVHSLRRISSE